ncbi:hypothetical protein Cantr_06733 [Candida viswanathii]|uniref:RRM domain-containing protein n=1 Tax=Candida viswanathii TaxID=5486 RepID=A0A367XUS8_9ASCO|nr:hypothetical protein Cantr_06733 [Candida viswanathii]
MTDTETPKEVRLHIGNISSRLQSTPDQLTSRLAKFGTITRPLEFHTKPLGTTIWVRHCVRDAWGFRKVEEIAPWRRFMGMKLSVSPAKPSYVDRFNRSRESGSGDEGSKTKQEEQLRRDRIVKSRLEKIKEYKTTYPTNNITSSIVPSSSLSPSTRSVSEHTYKNISGNTKMQPAPSVRLNGVTSYGALTTPKKIHDQFRLRAGRGQVIRGTHRRTPRLALALRQQTLRILINGELKLLRSYKTKLWGIEKGRTART